MPFRQSCKRRAEARGRQLAAKLKEVIPRQLYQVAIQAAIGGKLLRAECFGVTEKRDCEMLRRRYYP
jgi:GTP-binding protein LepA